LGEEQRKKLELEMKGKIDELQSERDNLSAKVRFAQESFRNVFQTQIVQVIAKIAKDEGLSAVFRKEMLLYSDPLPDVTEKVTKAFDDMPALEKGPPSQ
jgi:Skp family chaperone for outer membrane proteins